MMIAIADSELGRALAALAARESLGVVYAFGSRAGELAEAIRANRAPRKRSGSDLDLAVAPLPGRRLKVRDKVRIANALEDMLDASRVDLAALPEADPFLAAEIVRGERLYARDPDAADELELYVLRRAGDLAPLERERQALILGEAG